MAPLNRDVLLVQIQYPGMKAPESRVIRAFLEKEIDRYDRIEFDVLLGNGSEPDRDVAPHTLAQWKRITQKRADLIGWIGEAVEIVEAKMRAGLGAIGQLMGYRVLYIAEHPTVTDVRLRIIAALADPDVQLAAAANGIELELFPRARGGEEVVSSGGQPAA